LSERVELLVASIETTPFGAGQEPFMAELVVVALVIWLAVPAVASIVLGVALLRTVAA